jgi:hypothetical protein
MPAGMMDPMPQVKVTLDDGTVETLFSFYPDEISFSTTEFIGLTVEEARELRTTRDKQYLQS